MASKVASEQQPRVQFFSGKGGVGKTTLSAAHAIRLAQADLRVLILSTDPAHSLSDVLQVALSSTPRSVSRNLDAMEVDAEGMFGEFAAMADRSGAGVLGKIGKLASLSPGVDEFGALDVLLQAIEASDHDVIVLDTAPTGHALRLLNLPDLLDGWMGTMLDLSARLSGASRLVQRLWSRDGAGRLDGETLREALKENKQQMRKLGRLLRDPNQSQIYLVTIPEALSVEETLRTLTYLDEQGVNVARILINQIQPNRPHCEHCNHRHQLHETQLKRLEQTLAPERIIKIPASPTDIRGFSALSEFGQRIFACH